MERAEFQKVEEKSERRDNHRGGAKQYVDGLQTGLKEFHLFFLPLFELKLDKFARLATYLFLT